MTSTAGPKVLFLDVETQPSIAYVWGMFKQNISTNQLISSGKTICYAAKWQDDKEIMFDSLLASEEVDFLQELWELIDEADVIIHYNGKKFDMPTINREFIKFGILPPSPYQQIDLYHVVRGNFKFARNSMDFVCRELGIEGKVPHKGMELWTDCMEGISLPWGAVIPDHVEESWGVMEEYNKHDVVMTHKLYEKLRPWIRNHPNNALWIEPGTKPICPNCGSTHLKTKSYKHTLTMSYKQYHCLDCGTYPRERFAADHARGRRDVLRA